MSRATRSSAARASRTTAPAPAEAAGAVRFERGNWILLAAGFASTLGGFWLLAGGSTVAAPLLLMLGFLVLIPWGIIK